ncbi:MAG: hypothetical protein KJ709_03485 [Nanoarchaeota archaeon]|nr:hypothetical protein [Nanoarchaeota archaeon]
MSDIIVRNGNGIEIPRSSYLQSRGELEKLISVFKEVDGMRRIEGGEYNGWSNGNSNKPRGIYENTISVLENQGMGLSPQLITNFTREFGINPALVPEYDNVAFSVSGYDTTPFFLSGLVSHFVRQHPNELATLDVRGLKGKSRKHLGSYVENANVEILGDVGEKVGWEAKNSTFMIYGNSKGDPADDSEYSRLFIFGDVNGRCPGSAYFSQVFVDGKILGESDIEKIKERVGGMIYHLATELYVKDGEEYIKVWPLLSDRLRERAQREFLDLFKYGDRHQLQIEEDRARIADQKAVCDPGDIGALIQHNGRTSVLKMLSMAYRMKRLNDTSPIPLQIAEDSLNVSEEGNGVYVERKPRGLLEKGKNLLGKLGK